MSAETLSAAHERRELLHWTASLGAVTAEALALRRRISLASARGRLSAACRRGELTRSRLLCGCPALFVLTRRGARGIGLAGLRLCEVSSTNTHHLVQCAWAAAALERCYPDHRVIGEHELRRIERELGRSFASARRFGVRVGAERLHCPDLVLVPRSGATRPVAVEVELSVKAARRLREICSAWGRCREVAGVIYLVNSLTRRPVSRAVRDANVAERIAVLALDSLLGQQAAQAPA